MARPKNKIPSYLPHPASGQARVRFNGRDIYLGPYGSPESQAGIRSAHCRERRQWQASDNHCAGGGG